MDLNQYGAACRCLLRLRENEGHAGISDAEFIHRFLPQYPEWNERPGAADMRVICELARELGLAQGVECFRDYDQVLQEHRSGRPILVFTERAPRQVDEATPARRFATVLVEMNEDSFTLWCPYPSGLSDTLPRADRVWWDRWYSIGLVLHPPTAKA